MRLWKMLLCLSLATIPATSVAGQEAPPLEGVYIGCAESGGDMVPVATMFRHDGTLLSGAYLFIEPDGARVEGLLPHWRPLDSHTAEFDWVDKYGNGRLVVRWEGGGEDFTGQWRVDAEPGVHIWWGRRGPPAALEALNCGERRTSSLRGSQSSSGSNTISATSPASAAL